MRRYQAASRRGAWYVEHDTPETTRRWANWLLRELGIRTHYGRLKKYRAANSPTGLRP